MRLPVIPNVSTKDGLSNKNARLTNCLKETTKRGDKAVIRPGLVLDAEASGVGHGLVVFDNQLVSVYGSTLGIGVADGAPASVYTITDLEFRGVANLGGDSWLLYGYNFGNSNAEIYTGDSAGTMTLDSSGFDTTYPTQPLVASSVAYSGTTVIVAKDQSLQKSATGGSLSFSTIQTIAGSRQYFSIKYLGSKFVAVSLRTSTGQSTVRWSSDDGGTWNSWDAPTTNTLVYDVAYDGSAWWIFYFDDVAVELGAFKTTDFVTFTPQTFTGLNTFTTGGGYSAAYGSGYFYTSCAEDAVEGVAYVSSGGLAWTELPDLYSHFGEGASGVVYGVSATDIKQMTAGTGAVLADGFSAAYGFGANSSNSTIMVYELSDTYDVISSGTGSIPALATITGDYYDFAQSPI